VSYAVVGLGIFAYAFAETLWELNRDRDKLAEAEKASLERHS
jgi:hypothetical protein